MIFRYEGTSQITKEEIQTAAVGLESYVDRLNKVAQSENYTYEESSINLPFDDSIITRVATLKEKYVTSKLKYVIDIGIGGSNLGTKAIYDAMFGYFDVVEPERYPKMIFADTNDPSFIYKLYLFIKDNIKDPEEIIINAVCKSGSTTETIVNLEVITSGIQYAKDRLIITTDYNSPLWKTARNMKLECLPIPNKVGGRYSVFSSVGLFPLACLGIDISELLRGAMEGRKDALAKNIFKNSAMLSAIISFTNYVRGKLIHTNFIFHPELESLGKWYRQLMAESLGKDGKGITPNVAIGSVDLHSMLQLFLGGIRDKQFTFISTKNPGLDISIPQAPLIEIMNEVEERNVSEIMSAILAGVKITYAKNNLPFTEIILNDISLFSLGEYMQNKMIEIMYLGQLMGVNSFDQPNVESYKLETKKILSER